VYGDCYLALMWPSAEGARPCGPLPGTRSSLPHAAGAENQALANHKAHIWSLTTEGDSYSATLECSSGNMEKGRQDGVPSTHTSFWGTCLAASPAAHTHG
jgi:hypothetical protein